MSEAKRTAGPPSPWQRARLAAKNPSDSRNRVVDLVRAASITAVVLGHWLMAAPTVRSDEFTLSDMLHVSPWTQWLTWVFQVMPLFFVVGGYANAASWESARTSGTEYAAWLSRRLQRLVRPVVPFVLAWSAMGLASRWLGLSERLVTSGSRVAFVPTWFLAVYVLVVAVAPAMHGLWRRSGMSGFWALVAGALAVDAVRFGAGIERAGWLNYAFVWLALHHLGFAWRDGHLAARALPLAALGTLALVVLVGVASYPVSMVTVPRESMANANPPTLALLALGITHMGVVLFLEERARALLHRSALWTAVVLQNGVILTIYLWHATVMVLLVALAEWPGGIGLRFEPGSPSWWATRPTWILVLLAGLAAFVTAFGRMEASAPARPARPPLAARSVLGALAVCVGLVSLGSGGIGSPGPLGFRVWSVLLTIGGAFLVAAVQLPWARVTARAPSDRA